MENQGRDRFSGRQLVRLRWGLVECFDSGELATLCSDLDIPYDDIAGDDLEGKARELIAYLRRRGRLSELLELCRAIRPNYSWDETAQADATEPAVAQWQRRKQRESELNDSLRSERLPAYKDLWARLEPLAKYSRPAPLTFESAATLSEELRHWYFRVGGVYLSERCRKTYFALQEALQDVVTTADVPENEHEEVPNDELEFIRQRSSDLRATLAEDLGTRR